MQVDIGEQLAGEIADRYAMRTFGVIGRVAREQVVMFWSALVAGDDRREQVEQLLLGQALAE